MCGRGRSVVCGKHRQRKATAYLPTPEESNRLSSACAEPDLSPVPSPTPETQEPERDRTSVSWSPQVPVKSVGRRRALQRRRGPGSHDPALALRRPAPHAADIAEVALGEQQRVALLLDATGRGLPASVMGACGSPTCMRCRAERPGRLHVRLRTHRRGLAPGRIGSSAPGYGGPRHRGLFMLTRIDSLWTTTFF